MSISALQVTRLTLGCSGHDNDASEVGLLPTAISLPKLQNYSAFRVARWTASTPLGTPIARGNGGLAGSA